MDLWKRPKRKKERKKWRGERLQKRAAGGGGGPDIRIPHPYRQEYRVSTFPQAPANRSNRSNRSGPPHRASFLTMFLTWSTDKSGRIPAWKSASTVSRDKEGERGGSRGGWATPPWNQLRNHGAPNSISPWHERSLTHTPRRCYARHPSRRLPPRGRSLIYNEPPVIILWSRDYTREGDAKARLGFRSAEYYPFNAWIMEIKFVVIYTRPPLPFFEAKFLLSFLSFFSSFIFNFNFLGFYG